MIKWKGHDKSEKRWTSSTDVKHSQDAVASFLHSGAECGGMKGLGRWATRGPNFALLIVTFNVARFLRESLYTSSTRYYGPHLLNGSYGNSRRTDMA